MTPPSWNNIHKHAVMPETTHDEVARFNFITSLNKALAGFSLGNRPAFDKRVRPNFIAENGRDFENREELREEMKRDAYYQMWSALRRNTMEIRQQAGRSVVLRQAESLAQKAETLNAGKDSLQLDPNCAVPHYLSIMDNHLMPGSYHTELIPQDVTAAANYDVGIYATTGGALGKLNDGGGKAVALHLKKHFPDFNPKRILDIGCGLGHNTLPLAQAFPDAEIIAIDTGAPMLRYGHARAQDLGIKNVKFIQANGENLGFEDESFDYIQTIMFWHETANSAMYRMMDEIYRMLKPDGLHLHVEQPQYTPEMDLYEQFIRDWDAFYNNEPFWSKMHDLDMFDLMAEKGFPREKMLNFRAAAATDADDVAKPQINEPEDHGRAAIWNVFGGRK